MTVQQQINEINAKLDRILAMMGTPQMTTAEQNIKLILASGGPQALKEYAKAEADRKRRAKQ
jgi:DNA-binding CsgD family transcriptional regulator